MVAPLAGIWWCGPDDGRGWKRPGACGAPTMMLMHKRRRVMASLEEMRGSQPSCADPFQLEHAFCHMGPSDRIKLVNFMAEVRRIPPAIMGGRARRAARARSRGG